MTTTKGSSAGQFERRIKHLILGMGRLFGRKFKGSAHKNMLNPGFKMFVVVT